MEKAKEKMKKMVEEVEQKRIKVEGLLQDLRAKEWRAEELLVLNEAVSYPVDAVQNRRADSQNNLIIENARKDPGMPRRGEAWDDFILKDGKVNRNNHSLYHLTKALHTYKDVTKHTDGHNK